MNQRIPVLLAGADPAIRRVIRLLLADAEGVEVVAEAGNGDEALTLAERLRPSVVVLDCDADGPEYLQGARRLRELLDGPALVLLDTYGQCARPAADVGGRHVLKDAAARDLLPAIREVVARCRAVARPADGPPLG